MNKFTEKRFLAAVGVILVTTLVALLGPEQEDKIVQIVEASLAAAVTVLTALGYISSEGKVDVEKARNGNSHS
jgi:energy-converting hydrogenase Eha subunit E